MVRFDVVTLFPQLFQPILSEGLLGRAIEGGILDVTLVPLREHGLGKHRAVDDDPYGGGAGMVLRPEPIFAAVRERQAHHRLEDRETHTVLMTPQGRPFNQSKARRWAGVQNVEEQSVEDGSREDHFQKDRVLILVCGRYEGFDERIREGLADEEISLGDFVMLGGEVAAMAVIEAVARLLPGVLGNPASTTEESFASEGLEYPQYTRPPAFEGMRVPEVLLSGNHGLIDAWRKEQAHRRTQVRRPDLLARRLSDGSPKDGDG